MDKYKVKVEHNVSNHMQNYACFTQAAFSICWLTQFHLKVIKKQWMHITVWLFVHYFRPNLGCLSVGDAPSFSLQFKSLQLLLFLSNCCLLIHGNSIGLWCEPVDTGVQLQLVVGGGRRICRCTSQTGFHLDLDTVWKQIFGGLLSRFPLFLSDPPWLMEKLDSTVLLSVVSLAMTSHLWVLAVVNIQCDFIVWEGVWGS